MRNKAGAWIFLLVLAEGLVGCTSSNSDKTLFDPTPEPQSGSTLTVIDVQPNTGFIGSEVRILGSGFSSGATVTMGGIATAVAFHDSTLITVKTPAGAGAVDVVVTNPGGESAMLAKGYTYEVVTLTVNATLVAPGDQLSVSWSAPSGPFNHDWIGLFKVGDPNQSYDEERWEYATGSTGTMTFAAPATAGEYEFRYMLDDYFDAARSEVVIVSGEGSAPTIMRAKKPRKR